MPDLGTFLLLVAGGLGAGLSGTMAGLASLFSYPALLAAGLPAVAANVTNTVALTATSVGAAAGSRPELTGQWSTVRRFAAVVALGGALGAALLLVALPVSLLQGNAIKNVLLGLSNAVAAVAFAFFAPVAWWAVLPLALGALVGSRLGPVVARLLPATALRVSIALAGFGLAVVLAVGAW